MCSVSALAVIVNQSKRRGEQSLRNFKYELLSLSSKHKLKKKSILTSSNHQLSLVIAGFYTASKYCIRNKGWDLRRMFVSYSSLILFYPGIPCLSP